MALFTPAYRLTLMVPQSVDATETTPLTPVSGSVHTDAFKVATVRGLTGYQPYLDLPQGRKARYDPVSGRLDVGQLNFRLLDKRTNATTNTNLERWVTAFAGNALGQSVLKGCRVVVEECLDWNAVTNTGTWSAFMAGRLTDVSLDNPLWYSITVKDSTELDMPCFMSRPASSATNVSAMSFVPRTITANYGPYTPEAVLTGTLTSSPYYYASRRIALDANSVHADSNKWPAGISMFTNYGGIIDAVTTTSDYLLRLTSGSNTWDFKIVGWDGVYRSAGYSQITALDFTPTDATLMTTGSGLQLFPTGGVASLNIIPNALSVSKDNRIFVDSVHPAQMMKDVVQGKYGYLKNGVPLRSMQVDDTAFTSLIADTTYPPVRFAIQKESTQSQFIETQIAPLGLGYRVEPRTVSSSIMAVLVPFDTRLPQTLTGLPSMSNADVADMGSVKWTLGDPLSNITLKTYQERYTPYRPATGDVPEAAPVFEDVDAQLVFLRPDALNADGTSLTYDLQGVRDVVAEDSANPSLGVQIANAIAADSKRVILAHLDGRFGGGPAVADISCRRTTTVNGLQLGQWVLVTVDALPDPTTNKRGGQRLMQVIERSENGPTISLSLMDAGLNLSTTAPTTTNVTTSNDGYAITVTAIQNQRVNIQVAVTALGGARPADSSTLWDTKLYVAQATTGGISYYIAKAQWGFRYHVRVRTEAAGQVPSNWISASFVDITVPAGPTSLSVTNITGNAAQISWANPVQTTSLIEFAVASPTGSSYRVVDVLPENSLGIVLQGLSSGSASNPYGVQVRYADGVGGYSSGSVATFSVTATQPQCPNISAFYAVSSTLY